MFMRSPLQRPCNGSVTVAVLMRREAACASARRAARWGLDRVPDVLFADGRVVQVGADPAVPVGAVTDWVGARLTGPRGIAVRGRVLGGRPVP
jgi:hypothetical protein